MTTLSSFGLSCLAGLELSLDSRVLAGVPGILEGGGGPSLASLDRETMVAQRVDRDPLFAVIKWHSAGSTRIPTTVGLDDEGRCGKGRRQRTDRIVHVSPS